jgi:hypothetical protein
MNVAELLDELRTNVLRDSSALVAGTSDRYWSDESLIRYLDEAHTRFARLTLCLRDETTDAATAIYLVPDVATYALSPSVLAVLSARLDGQVLNQIRTGQANEFGAFDEAIRSLSCSTLAGTPIAFATDDQVGPQGSIQIRLFPTPDTASDGARLQLRVCRLPLRRLTLDDTSAVPEIPDIYHLDLVEWAAFRALRNWDVDSENRPKAETHRARFEQAVQEAQREMRHKVFAPVGWVFGRHGFSW